MNFHKRLLISFLLVSNLWITPIFAQGEEVVSNLFMKFNIGVLPIIHTPATWEFSYVDQASNSLEVDSIYDLINFEDSRVYGIGFDFSYLMKKNFVVNFQNFVGFSREGLSYIGTLGLAYEMKYDKFYIQPGLGLSFIYGHRNIGSYSSVQKGYFEIDNQFVVSDLTASLQSYVLSLNPSFYFEYPLPKSPNIAPFLRVGGLFSIHKSHRINLSGTTDAFNAEGSAIFLNEKPDYLNDNMAFYINNQRITSPRSPYININYNTLFIQAGLSLRLYSSFAE